MKRYNSIGRVSRFPVNNHYLNRVSSYRGGVRL